MGHIQFGDRVLNAALDRRAGAADDIAGDPDHEDVAHAYVEEDLRGDPGIRAGDDHGMGILSFRKGAKIFRAATWACGLAFHKTSVAFEEVVPRPIGADGRRGFS